MPNISSIGRTTPLGSTSQLLAALQRTQREMLDAQVAISTGVEVNRPSEYPARTAGILMMQGKLEARTQHDKNLGHALSILNNTDASLGDLTNILLEAKTIASEQIGIGSSTETRANQAVVVAEQLRSIVDIANREYQNVSLFGGKTTNGRIFEDFLGGIRYTGSRDNLGNEVGLDQLLGLNANGQDAFGALSLRVESATDLNPGATAATRLSDVNGTQGQGIRKGQIEVTVNGTQVVVDLSNADNLGDVVTRVNNAINSVNPAAGSLAVASNGLSLTANGGFTIDIADVGAGQNAADLGIAISATAATVGGGDLDPRLTELTTLASLGAAVDFASGLKITQGDVTKIADFSSATTVRDMINVVEQLNLGLRMEISDDGSALNIVNEVSGLQLSIGENAGGTTATDLGLRTLGLDTELADFRLGLGIEPLVGEDDFRIELHDGSSFDVNIDGASTVSELLTAINTAATTAGLTVGGIGAGGTDLNIGLAADGNGLAFEDGTAGGGDFRVVQLNTSLAATQLGIYQNAGAGSSITGDDNAKVRVDSAFTHLMELHDALVTDDEFGIRFAGEGIEEDIDQAARSRADIGVRANRIEKQQDRSQELRVLEESTLSDLRDADLTEVITRFQQLQQQLQATMAVGAQNLQTSFLDFLR